MIKPTEKIDKGAKQLQLCKVGWGQISSCPGGAQSTGGLGQADGAHDLHKLLARMGAWRAAPHCSRQGL